MKVGIFSDMACPFCYIGTRNFARAFEASWFGIAGVPAFIFDRSTGVSGAQPPELLRRAIDQALSSAT